MDTYFIAQEENTKHTMADCLNRILQREKEMDEFFEVDDDYITLCGYYHIEKNRCANYESILNWVLHLSEKNWMDMPKLNRFIKIACASNGLKYPEERI